MLPNFTFIIKCIFMTLCFVTVRSVALSHPSQQASIQRIPLAVKIEYHSDMEKGKRMWMLLNVKNPFKEAICINDFDFPKAEEVLTSQFLIIDDGETIEYTGPLVKVDTPINVVRVIPPNQQAQSILFLDDGYRLKKNKEYVISLKITAYFCSVYSKGFPQDVFVKDPVFLKRNTLILFLNKNQTMVY